MQGVFQHKDSLLSYLFLGDPDQQPVVFLVSSVIEDKHYHDLMEILSKNYFVVSVDLPGAGKSWCKNELNSGTATTTTSSC